MSGLPPGYGKANNPTGKGLVHDGSQGMGGLSKRAAHTVTKMLIKIIMEDSENGKARVENMIRAQVKAAENGDFDAFRYLVDRVAGKQDTLADALREGGATISRIEFVVVDPIDAGRNSPEITTTYETQ